jgi:hypothetical protein
VEFPERSINDYDPTLDAQYMDCIPMLEHPFKFKLQDFTFGCEYMPSDGILSVVGAVLQVLFVVLSPLFSVVVVFLTL